MKDCNDQQTLDLLGSHDRRRARVRASHATSRPDPASLSDTSLIRLYTKEFKSPTLPKEYWARLGAEIHGRRAAKTSPRR